MKHIKYCPDPRASYLCPYCNTTARLADADVVIDSYTNVCHLACLDKVRGTGEKKPVKVNKYR